jgi:hypothetical protein
VAKRAVATKKERPKKSAASEAEGSRTLDLCIAKPLLKQSLIGVSLSDMRILRQNPPIAKHCIESRQLPGNSGSQPSVAARKTVDTALPFGASN